MNEEDLNVTFEADDETTPVEPEENKTIPEPETSEPEPARQPSEPEPAKQPSDQAAANEDGGTLNRTSVNVLKSAPSLEVQPDKYESSEKLLAHTRSLTRTPDKSLDSDNKQDSKAEALTRIGKSEKHGSRAKLVLGSVIDVRRSVLTGDLSDRRNARYMNTYKLESDKPFNKEKVNKILNAVLRETIDKGTSYDSDNGAKQARWASMAIRTKVKELGFDRYKIVSLVTIGEKNSQDMFVATRFLWDVDKDRFATCVRETTQLFAIAQCFGLYYE